jgi:hypothetical protein
MFEQQYSHEPPELPRAHGVNEDVSSRGRSAASSVTESDLLCLGLRHFETSLAEMLWHSII